MKTSCKNLKSQYESHAWIIQWINLLRNDGIRVRQSRFHQETILQLLSVI